MDKSIRKKLEGFSQAPPLHIWDNIQGQLQAQKRKRRIIFISRIAAAAVVLLAFLAGWYFSEKSSEITPALTENRTEQIQSKSSNSENEPVKSNTEKNVSKEELQAENEKEKTIEKKNNLTETLLANQEIIHNDEENETQQSTNELETTVKREHYNLNALNKIEALLGKNENKKLQLKQKTIQVNKISEAEEKLIAENIRNLDNSGKDEMKWKLGVQVSPGYSSQSSSYSKVYSNSMTYSGKSGNANITGGLSIQMKAGKKWSIESGVYYAQNGQRSTNSRMSQSDNYTYSPISDEESSYFNTVVNMSNGQIAMNSTAGVIQFSKTPPGTEVGSGLDAESITSSPTLLTNSEFSQVFEFIEVPLYLRYSLIDTKFGVELMGGVNAGIVAGNNVYMENQFGNQNIGKTKDISTLNLSGTIGVGLNYDLSKHISLAVEPRFNYYLNSINHNPAVDYRPYRIGVYSGMYYSF